MENKMKLDPTYLHKVGKKLTWDDLEASKKFGFNNIIILRVSKWKL